MLSKRHILSVILLLFVTLTTAADDGIRLRSCRRGTPRPHSVNLRRSGSEGRTPGGSFYHGERHQLTVLVAFNDRSFIGDEASTLEQWNKIFNVENLTEAPFKGSVHDYFMAQSYDDFNVIFDLLYVQVSGDAKKYASTNEDDENSQYLVQDIMDVLKTLDIEWNRYDWNGDGYVNQLLIVYAGQGMNNYDKKQYTDLIWPHQWWMSEHLKDRQEGVYCEPIPVTVGSETYLVDCYCALAELTRNNDYGSFGTICHEYSHCFGFPDFYYDQTSYVYGWDLMDRGNYNGDGYQPPCYSAHERWLMGWLTPIELKEATTITDMPALEDEGRAYLIRNDGYENEYYFVENRQMTGWDASLPGSGIMVFHIDYDPSVWAGTTVTTNSSRRQRYILFHANNSSYDYKEWAYPHGSTNALTNTSTPAATLFHTNTDGTKLMNKSLTEMSVTGGLASFNFSATSTGVQHVDAELQQATVLYRFGMVDIVRDAKGEIRKVIRK